MSNQSLITQVQSTAQLMLQWAGELSRTQGRPDIETIVLKVIGGLRVNATVLAQASVGSTEPLTSQVASIIQTMQGMAGALEGGFVNPPMNTPANPKLEAAIISDTSRLVECARIANALVLPL